MNAKYMLVAVMVIGVFVLAPVLQAANFTPPTFKLHTKKFVTGTKFANVGRNASMRLTSGKPGGSVHFCNPGTFRVSNTRVLMPASTANVVRIEKSTLDINRRFDDMARRIQQEQNKTFFKPAAWIGSTIKTRREF